MTKRIRQRRMRLEMPVNQEALSVALALLVIVDGRMQAVGREV